MQVQVRVQVRFRLRVGCAYARVGVYLRAHVCVFVCLLECMLCASVAGVPVVCECACVSLP